MLLGTWFVQVVMVMVMVSVMVMVTMVVLMKTTTALTVLTGRSRRLHPNAARGQHIIHRALSCNNIKYTRLSVADARYNIKQYKHHSKTDFMHTDTPTHTHTHKQK